MKQLADSTLLLWYHIHLVINQIKKSSTLGASRVARAGKASYPRRSQTTVVDTVAGKNAPKLFRMKSLPPATWAFKGAQKGAMLVLTNLGNFFNLVKHPNFSYILKDSEHRHIPKKHRSLLRSWVRFYWVQYTKGCSQISKQNWLNNFTQQVFNNKALDGAPVRLWRLVPDAAATTVPLHGNVPFVSLLGVYQFYMLTKVKLPKVQLYEKQMLGKDWEHPACTCQLLAACPHHGPRKLSNHASPWKCLLSPCASRQVPECCRPASHRCWPEPEADKILGDDNWY